MARSASQCDDTPAGLPGARPLFIPMDLETEIPSTGLVQDVAKVLNDKLDQIGLGIFWDKNNLKAVRQPARNAEWGAELYYNYTIFTGLQLTPDMRLYFDPALKPGAGPAAVFTLRATV